jgi:hypothetical protein
MYTGCAEKWEKLHAERLGLDINRVKNATLGNRVRWPPAQATAPRV